jgi:tetratricopeptide (TPR) repeat protein
VFILVPLGVILISIIGIGIIIFRKMPYLKKLTPESHEFGPTVFHDFFPEFFARFNKARFEEYSGIFFREMEKLLRKIRIFFSRIDRASSDLITELRNANKKNEQNSQPEISEPLLNEPTVSEPNKNIEVHPRKIEPDMVALKAEEQKYIIEIAQHPKDAKLYATLGEIYIKMGNFVDAKESFEAAIGLDAADELFKDRLAFVSRKIHENEVGF